MVNREDIGSWLEGPQRVGGGAYPGERLGLPEEGSGSMAGIGRRVVAILIDGFISQIIAVGLLGFTPNAPGLDAFKPLLVLGVMNIVLVSTVGTTIGHRLLGIRVERLPRGWVGWKAGTIRAVLLCLAIPPFINDTDGRGLHDLLAGTVIVRR
ncbi:RDD family [Dermatophilus congolensis]|uniref:RDD family n=1 Tax=Dermatophilus congolensis TaxID=1863 RepID=A0AA46H0G8_9MICO|nr:RDD family protein [Dermatophilus congolensis]STD09396.1 RDD family [Dermatophilus congolensis]